MFSPDQPVKWDQNSYTTQGNLLFRLTFRGLVKPFFYFLPRKNYSHKSSLILLKTVLDTSEQGLVMKYVPKSCTCT